MLKISLNGQKYLAPLARLNEPGFLEWGACWGLQARIPRDTNECKLLNTQALHTPRWKLRKLQYNLDWTAAIQFNHSIYGLKWTNIWHSCLSYRHLASERTAGSGLWANCSRCTHERKSIWYMYVPCMYLKKKLQWNVDWMILIHLTLKTWAYRWAGWS